MVPDREEEEDGESGTPRGGDIVRVEITDELDLHTFHPRDVKSLLAEYLDECARLGFRQVRIVHGKGRGVLRRIVQAALDRHPRVISYRLADGPGGGWVA